MGADTKLHSLWPNELQPLNTGGPYTCLLWLFQIRSLSTLKEKKFLNHVYAFKKKKSIMETCLFNKTLLGEIYTVLLV